MKMFLSSGAPSSQGFLIYLGNPTLLVFLIIKVFFFYLIRNLTSRRFLREFHFEVIMGNIGLFTYLVLTNKICFHNQCL